jgi:hypothetical protein
MVQKYLRPAAIKAGVIKEDERVRFGFHNFRHSLASSLVKLNLGLKRVGETAQVLWNVVARDGVEPPTPAFSGSKLTVIAST